MFRRILNVNFVIFSFQKSQKVLKLPPPIARDFLVAFSVLRLHRAWGTCPPPRLQTASYKKLTKLHWPSLKRSPTRLIVLVEPKKWRDTTKNFHMPPTFKFVQKPLYAPFLDYDTFQTLFFPTIKSESCFHKRHRRQQLIMPVNGVDDLLSIVDRTLTSAPDVRTGWPKSGTE